MSPPGPQAAAQKVQRRPKKAPPKQPETLAELFRLLLKRFLIGLIWQVPLAAVLFFVIWVFHTFLLVYVNEGFNTGGSGDMIQRALNGMGLGRIPFVGTLVAFGTRIVDSLLATRGRFLISTLTWMLLGSLFSATFVRFIRGPIRFIKDTFGTPSWMARTFKNAKTPLISLSVLFAGAAMGMGFGVAAGHPRFLASRLLVLLLGLHGLTQVLAHLNTLTGLVARLGWSDLQRWQGGTRPLKRFRQDWLLSAVFGLSLGLVVASVTPFLLFCGCGGFLLLFLAALASALLVVSKGKAGAAPAAMTLVLIAGMSLLFLVAVPVHADDGGWAESGGTMQGWINSEGAGYAMGLGLGPAAGAAAGLIAGGAAGSLAGVAAGAGAGGADAGEGAGAFGTDWNGPTLWGGADSNPYTAFDPGSGSPGDCSRFGLPKYSVNTATLGLVIEDTLFAYKGLGPALSFTLTYNAGSRRTGSFGPGWSFSYQDTLEEKDRYLTLLTGSGQHRVLGPLSDQGEGGMKPAGPVLETRRQGQLPRREGAAWLLEDPDRKLRRQYENAGEYAWRLKEIRDFSGNPVALGYNSDGTLCEIKDAAGRATRLTYDQRRLCRSIVFPDGKKALFSYDEAGHLAGVADREGILTAYDYDGGGALAKMTVSNSATTFAYDQDQGTLRVASIRDALGNVTRFERLAEEPFTVRVTDPEGRAWTYASREGLTETVVDPLGRKNVVAFERGLPVAYQNAAGQVTRVQYDTWGKPVAAVGPGGSAERFEYDEKGNLTKETNALGQSLAYEYDGKSNLVLKRFPSGREISFTYDERGQMTSVKDPAGKSQSFAFDAFGNVVASADRLGAATRMSYDGQGLLKTATTDPLGHTIRFEYDSNHRLTRVINPDGTLKLTQFGCCAEAQRVDENGNATRVERDPLQRIVRHVDPMESVTAFQMDRSGKLLSATDALGRTIAIEYDRAGRPLKLAGPLERRLEIAYDAAGHLATLRDERGMCTRWGYDAEGRRASLTDSLNRTSTLAYDRAGRPAETANARGGKISVEYDPDGRMLKKTIGDILAGTYEYDAAGNLTKAVGPEGATRFERDEKGRVLSVDYPDGHKASFQFDANGNIGTIAYPGGLTVRHTYDSRNRLVNAEWGPHRVRLAYDSAGNLISEARSNGTETAISYDRHSRIASIGHRLGAGAFARTDLKRDRLGNVIGESGRIPVAPSFTAFESAAEFDRANQLIRWGQADSASDADGNLTDLAGGKLRAEYDAENRLTKVIRDGASVEYAYGATGFRIRATVEGKVRNFHHDPAGRLLFETDGKGRLVAAYVYCGPMLAAMVTSKGQTYFYHLDHLGSTRALTGENGAVAAAYAYGPFGEPAGKSGAIDNPFTFGGGLGVMDEGGGLYFMRTRTYDAHLGRFLQRDSIGMEGGSNLYAYADNNPVTLVDPHGYWGNALGDWKTWAGLGLAGLGGVIMFIPGGQIAGYSAIHVGGTLMAAGVTLDIYSMATSTSDIDKARNAQFNKAKNLLTQGADGKWSLPSDDVTETLYPPGSDNRRSLEELIKWKNSQPAPASCSAPSK